MKITAVKSFAFKATHRNIFIVKIETDHGLYGIGESGTSSREMAISGAIEHFAQFLVGEDPRRIEHIWQLLYRGQYFEGGTILAAALSAVDIALWDLMGKMLEVPVYQLLGGKTRNHVQCYTHAGTLNGPQCVEQAKDLVAAGWHHLRYDPGHLDPASDPGQGAIYEPRESMAQVLHWLQEIRRVVGPDIALLVDLHHRLSVAEAADFCRKVERFDPFFVEEPIRSENPDAYALLRKMTNLPFAIGEEFASKWAFRPFIEHGLMNFARVDLCNVGGLTEAKKVAGWCETHYIDMVPHNPLGPVSTVACGHFCTAIPNFALLEHIPGTQWEPAEAFTGIPELEQDRLVLSDRPGLGIEFNEEAVKDHAFEFIESPHLFRRDGSYTNW